MPPFHCYCRSTTVPYVEGVTDYEEGDTRAARNPETGKTEYVQGNLTYPEWKKQYVDSLPTGNGKGSQLGEQSYAQKEKVSITQETINNVIKFKYPGLNDTQNNIMQQRQMELLQYARDYNNSNEVALILDENLNIVDRVKGSESVIDSPPSILTIGKAWVLHNHPHCGPLSFLDVSVLLDFSNVYGMCRIGNNGQIEALTKGPAYDRTKISDLMHKKGSELLLSQEYMKADNEVKDRLITDLFNSLLKQWHNERVFVWKK